MSLKHFEFTIRNTRTNETCEFIGQGETIEEAFKDGAKNVIATFRPRDGAKRDEHGISVTLRDGRKTNCTLKVFESDAGASPKTLPPAKPYAPIESDAGFLRPYPYCTHCAGAGCDRCIDEHKKDHWRAFPHLKPAPQPESVDLEFA